MTFTQLEILSKVAESRGFTAAAFRLGISQSAVSHAIKALEDELGVALVSRSRNSIELTDIGQIMLKRARTLLGIAETMRQEAGDARGLKSGTVRVGSFGPTASMRILPCLLKAFQKDYPGIEIHIEEGTDSQVLQWLTERRIDIGFAVLPDNRFDTCMLAEDQLVALLPATHRLAKEKAISLHQLADDPFILTGAGSAELVMRQFVQAGIVPRIRYRGFQLLSILETVSRGAGVSIVAELSLPPEKEPGYVWRPLDPPVPRSIGLATLGELNISPAANAFLRLSRRIFKTPLSP